MAGYRSLIQGAKSMNTLLSKEFCNDLNKGRNNKQSRHFNSIPFSSHFAFSILILCLLGFTINSGAQKADTSDKIKITISNSGEFVFNKTDSGEYNKFLRDVVLYQGTDTLYCDSLYQNNITKNFEAFSHVRIAQAGGTQGTSDYLRYTTEKKLAYMSGDVHLTDGKNKLDCETLTYNLGTKIAQFDQWGTLHNDSTNVTSRSGIYNSNTKDARFTYNVIINDPQYKVRSEDLNYNTESKITKFYAKSTVTRDSGRSILQTSNGTYDGKLGVAHFTGHSSLWYDDQYIEGDTLYYNKANGYGLAQGNVISLDTSHHSTIYCGHAEYYSKKRVIWATIHPVLVQANEKDTLYMRADTFYSAPMVKAKIQAPKDNLGGEQVAAIMNSANTDDTLMIRDKSIFEGQKPANDSLYPSRPNLLSPRFLKDTIGKSQPTKVVLADKPTDTLTLFPKATETKTNQKGQKGKTKDKVSKSSKTESNKPIAKAGKKGTPIYYELPGNRPMHYGSDSLLKDTTSADTTAPLYFIGFHHVLIFSDSLQGKCDSVCYTRSDSIIRMMYAPIIWAHNSQITGDTILMQLDSSSLRNLYVPNSAFMVSISGPEKAKLYDQVQGRTLRAWFSKKSVDSMLVFPDAESIYYAKDEKGAYIGIDQSKSVMIRMFFADQKIKRIKLLKDPHITMTPLDRADIPNTRLSRFKWLIDQRPKSKEELFRY